MLNNSDTTVGAITAIILDYAAVALVIGLLVLDRWLGVRRGITLDTLFALIVALGVAAWFAGIRFKRRLLRDPSAGTDITQMLPPDVNGRRELRKDRALALQERLK